MTTYVATPVKGASAVSSVLTQGSLIGTITVLADQQIGASFYGNVLQQGPLLSIQFVTYLQYSIEAYSVTKAYAAISG